MRIAAPLFVPPTKDGKLATKLREEEEILGKVMGWKYKVVERGGRQLKELLTKSDMFSTEKCGRPSCMACRDAGKPLNCRRRGLVYETSCLECLDSNGGARARYVGETARSLSERYSEHVEDGEKGTKSSHMSKHWSVHHGGNKTKFKVEIIGFFSSALERQVAESVRIDKCGAERILNSKSVFSRSMVPRLVAVDTVEVV